MSTQLAINPDVDLVFERFVDAPRHLVWEALTKPEHVRKWWMPRQWGSVAHCEMDVRPGGIFRIDIALADGQPIPNVGCFLEVIPMERLTWTSMLLPGYRPAVFDDVPITAVLTLDAEGAGHATFSRHCTGTRPTARRTRCRVGSRGPRSCSIRW